MARSPDIQFHLGLGSGIEAGVAQMNNPGVTLNSAFLRPRSRGTVRLRSAGTCAMGTGPDSVPTPDLNVRGIEGLRVADASVMPFVPSCNTNAPTIMVAEKASDLILAKTGTGGSKPSTLDLAPRL